jgi:hypothetical protein
MMNKRLINAGAGLATLLALVGCGTSASSKPPASHGADQTSSTSSAPSLTAAEVVAELRAHGLPVKGIVVYNATTDPNHLLGRPSGYTSKAAWLDSRIKPSQASDSSAGSVDLGGSVEVYPTPAGAEARGKYIATIAAHVGFASEYDYVHGGELLRLSTVLTPAQAQQYAAVIAGTLIKAS